MNEEYNNYDEPSTGNEIANMGRKTVGVVGNVGNLALGMGKGLAGNKKNGDKKDNKDKKDDNDKGDDGNSQSGDNSSLPKKDSLDSSDDVKDLGKKTAKAGGKLAKEGTKAIGKGLKALWKLIPFPWNFLLLGFLLIIVLVVAILTFSAANDNNCSYEAEVTYDYSCTQINLDGQLIDFEEYVIGVVSGESYAGQNIEAIKAQAVAARTYALMYTNDCQKEIISSQKAQVYNSNYRDDAREAVEATKGEVLTYNGNIFYSMYDSFYVKGSKCSGSTCSISYTKLPNGESHRVSISSAYFSKAAGGHGQGMSQVASYEMADNGSTYDEILKYFYSDGVVIANHTSENCEEETEKVDGGFRSTLYFYDQTDYTNVAYCGRTIVYASLGYCGNNQNSICSSGCGGTSAAMAIASLLDDSSITPESISSELGRYFSSSCSYSGTSFAGITGVAERHGLNTSITSSTNEVYNALSTGNALVIVNMYKSCFTGAGHYILLTGAEDGNVHILDPNGGDKYYTRLGGCPVAQRIRNGWWSYSDVLSQSHNPYFIIISDMDINQLVKDK